MADIKFSCPSCQQHIEADAAWAGLEVNCPTCQTGLLVPAAPAPPPAPAPGLRLSTHAAQPTAPAPAPASEPAVSSASGCPSCGHALPRGAVLCVNCGYNLRTGQRMVAGQAVAPGRPAADPWHVPWYKSPYPYLGLVVVVLATLYLLGRQDPKFQVGFVVVGLLFTVSVHIAVLVAAFRESVGTGFLAMCIPFYALYFVFKTSDSDTLKIFYGAAVIINIAMRLILRGMDEG